MRALAPILRARGVVGLVEPLGFPESSLRLKRTAVDAVGHADTFKLLHDTFRHAVAGETEIFPLRTGLVHISGVEDKSVTAYRDAHRAVVRAVLPEVQRLPDLAPALRASMDHVTNPRSHV